MYGDALIAACAETGTHYFDLTGETIWASRQISKLSDKAKQSKAIIVLSCGFDSVPSDLATMIAARELKQIAGKDASVGRVTSGFSAQGGVGGATIASLLGNYDEGLPALRKAMSCYFLSPSESLSFCEYQCHCDTFAHLILHIQSKVNKKRRGSGSLASPR